MKRLALSIVSIVFAGGVIASGATGAFFSDTETSTGNTVTAGAIDLKIDNSSYYNGVATSTTSWSQKNLTIEKFFNFLDLKPNDYGEDTISLHVDTNDAYLCADVTLTSNNDNTQTEPEALVDANGLASGELANLVNFIWWADDGDNVLETGENVISNGPIGALTIGQPFSVTLADSANNIWTGLPGPIPGNTTKHIGEAWCFGTIGTAPITQDNSGILMSPAGNNGGTAASGEPQDGGITCNGALLGNESQTDSLTADVSFSAVQSRNNAAFTCRANTCNVASTTNHIANGSFEAPIVSSGEGWDIFPSVAGNWNVEWRNDVPPTFGAANRPLIALLELHRGVLGAASDLQQYTELDSDWDGHSNISNGEPASTKIYQDIATVPGAQYKIKFAFAPRPNTASSENQVEVTFGGVLAGTVGPIAGGGGPIAWSEYEYNVLATTTVTRVEFTDLGTANSMGSFLDNVRLNQITCAIN